MKRCWSPFIAAIVTVASATAGLAQEEPASGIDAAINQALTPVSELVHSIVFVSVPVAGTPLPIVVALMAVSALFFTLYLGFVNIRGFGQALRLVRGDYADPSQTGEVSHFQALATAVSGTVGVGNIGAVAVLVTLGGPGAAFWMMFAGFLGMSTKCVECTLGVKYRKVNPDGTVSGGPMYYLSRGLAELGWPSAGKAMAAFFAVSIVIGGLGIGNMWQSNQAYLQLVNVTGGAEGFFGDKGWLVGVVLALLTASVIIGGIKSIARVTDKLVPFMAAFYLGCALLVLIVHAERLPAALAAIFGSALSPEGVTGGLIGVIILGFQRAIFSNEAGLGSAPIAHSAVRTDEPMSEGLVSLLEPFIDTVIICTMTALVIVVTIHVPDSPLQESGLAGVALTSAAFATTFAWFPYPLALAVMLFAFSTLIAWSYYGLKGWTYLFGESRAADISFKAVFCLFVILGCTVELEAVLDFSDAMTFAMAVPNAIGLFLLAPVVKREMRSYFARLRSGEIRSHRNRRLAQERPALMRQP